MNYIFSAEKLRSIINNIAEECFNDISLQADDEKSPLYLIAAIEKAIDVMERGSSDKKIAEKLSAEHDVTQIGDYALALIEGVTDFIRDDSDQQYYDDRIKDLKYMTVVVALWVATHGGKIDRLEIVVNAIAGYANELSEPEQLAELCGVIRSIIDAVSDDIQQDMEQTNPVRPWRILNFNYGIVATRSHNPQLIEKAYDVLVENLPNDARGFFREGMKQMDIVGYPNEVRVVIEKYDRLWGSDSTLH